MALALSDYQQRFKKFGKFIYTSQLANSYISPLKSAHAATVDQASQSSTATEFDVNNNVVSVLGTTIKTVATSLATVATAELTAAQNFLINFVGLIDLGLPGNPSAATVGAALATAMSSVGATVAPSGTNGANASGIAMYFASNWGIVLPQNASPTIPDSYITPTVL